MMEKGISIYKLICDEVYEEGELKYNQAKIFKIEFDYDDWPSNHTNESYEIRPYNGSFYHIFDKYSEVFPEGDFESIEGKDIRGAPVYKIKYAINLIPSLG